MIVYVAGPYRGNVHQNIDNARQVAQELWRKGYAAICPHLNTALFDEDMPDLPVQVYLEGDFQILSRCDAILMIPGWEDSVGSALEYAYAEREGIPIYVYPELPRISTTESERPVQCAGFISHVMKMYRVHLLKNEDYSPANILMTDQVGLATRVWDKVARLISLHGIRIEIEQARFVGMPEMGCSMPMLATFYNAIMEVLFSMGLRVDIKSVRMVEPPQAKYESIEDNLQDLSVYSVIWRLHREGKWGR
jgi:nucleoside 2-deoxyribosyltransferase